MFSQFSPLCLWLFLRNAHPKLLKERVNKTYCRQNIPLQNKIKESYLHDMWYVMWNIAPQLYALFSIISLLRDFLVRFASVKFLCMSACQCMQITPCTLAAFSVVYSRERAPSPLLQNAVCYTICLWLCCGFYFKILKMISVGQPFKLHCVSVMQVQSVIFSHAYNVLLAAE